MPSTLPPLQSLRALDAVARLGSLTAAAERLNLTRSAISHQLKLLQDRVGISLYERHGRGITLTVAGKQYAANIGELLRNLERIHSNLAEQPYPGRLKICIPPGFGAHVVSRHITQFRHAYPAIELEVTTAHEEEIPQARGFDVYVIYADQVPTSDYVEFIARPIYTPVCSPRLLNDLELVSVDDLSRATLLHLHEEHEWQLWFASCRQRHSFRTDTGIYFSNLLLILHAALAGQGVAMGDDIVCADLLRQGQLVRPFPNGIVSDRTYYLVTPEDRLDDSNVQAFTGWLRQLVTDLGPASDPASPQQMRRMGRGVSGPAS